MHTKIHVTHLEIFTTGNKAVLHSNTHEIEHRYFWSTWPWINPPRGKPVWNICLYMRRIDGGIQQVQNIDEPVTIAAWYKLKYKSKPSKCALGWYAPQKCYQDHWNWAKCQLEALNIKPLHNTLMLKCSFPLKHISLQSDKSNTSPLLMRLLTKCTLLNNGISPVNKQIPKPDGYLHRRECPS